jgi:hypothetical protein
MSCGRVGLCLKFGAKLQNFFETAKELRQNMHAVPSVFFACLLRYMRARKPLVETVLLVPLFFLTVSCQNCKMRPCRDEETR